MKNVKATGGGDYPECYELAMKECREKLNWTRGEVVSPSLTLFIPAPMILSPVIIVHNITGSQRALVMIGDAIPHELSHYDNLKTMFGSVVKDSIDWRVEADKLLDMVSGGYTIFPRFSGVNSAVTDDDVIGVEVDLC